MAIAAILENITTNTYPDSEHLSSTTLSPTDLSTLLESLRREQSETRTSILTLSRQTSTPIDTWIAQAKELQSSILASRDLARQIVAEAEEGKTFRAEVEDKRKKIELLEKEVKFNETLAGTLEHVKYAGTLLERTQEDAVKGNVEAALRRLDDAEASILGVPESRAREVLKERVEGLKANLIETATECWDAFLLFDFDQRKFGVRSKGLQADVPDAEVSVISLEQIVAGTKGLGCFDALLKKLGRDLEKVVLRERVCVDEDGLVARVRVKGEELVLGGKKSEDLSVERLFRDLGVVFEFLNMRLPSSITVPLSSTLIPALSSLLEEHWLEPSIPLTLAEIPPFTSLMQHLSHLIDRIESYGWNGTEGLKTWMENAPTMWLTKRREAVLGDVRDLVFTGLKEREVVERVETRVVRKDDMAMSAVGAGGGVEGDGEGAVDDEWDSAWDEPEEETSTSGSKTVGGLQKDEMGGEDDDTSAWDVEDEGDGNTESGSTKGEDEEDWGAWDDEPTSKPPSPTSARKSQPTKPNGKTTTSASLSQSAKQEQELTLRETLTITSIPSHLLSILQTIISDAETLTTSPQYSASPLSQAAKALYNLPTLALAIYRATAPTTYTSRLDAVGNMLIYNDALHLAEQLRSWQSSRPPSAGKLRLDNDVHLLETSAKRAYSSEMESQRTILKDILSGAQGFANCTSPPFKQECESAVKGVVERLRDVEGFWRDVLARGALLQSLGSLLGTVTSEMISEIEDLGDIGEQESVQLKAMCEQVMEVRELFVQGPSSKEAEDSAGRGVEGEGRDMTFVYCPTWLKFQYLAEILESSLADIRWMWKEGELRLEFDAEEVVELVEALFAESEYRRSAVREIRKNG